MIVETYASSVIFLFCRKKKLELAQCGFEAHVSEKCARDVKMGDKAARRPSPACFSIPSSRLPWKYLIFKQVQQIMFQKNLK